MKAFIKTNRGTFPDVNFYQAWKGCVELGYDVVLMDDVEPADFTVDTPVFAGARIFDRVMERLGITYERVDTYPKELHSLLHRKLEKMTLKEAKSIFDKSSSPMFVKPILNKQFHGNLWKSCLDLIPLANVSDDAEVIVSEPIKFVSEFRCYINDKELIAIRHYTGDFEQPIKRTSALDAIDMFKSSPIAYSIDLGVVQTKDGFQDALVEVNDGTSLGNYGLDSIHYAEMLIARWHEIVHKKS